MPQFDATIKHLAEGEKGFSASAATKNIEGWETALEKVESPAAKAIVKDLESLKKHLHAEKPDNAAIQKLMAKLGKETVAIGKKTEGPGAEKIQALGEALSHSAEHTSAAGAKA